MKNKGIIIGVLIALVIVGIVIGVVVINKQNSMTYKYGNQAIEILTYYKEGKLEPKKAAEQFKEIEEILRSEVNQLRHDMQYDKASKIADLEKICYQCYFDLYFKEMSLLDINNTIEEIKKLQ